LIQGKWIDNNEVFHIQKSRKITIKINILYRLNMSEVGVKIGGRALNGLGWPHFALQWAQRVLSNDKWSGWLAWAPII
jgi:hypothetical protein